MTEKETFYETALENLRDKSVAVYEADGTFLLSLSPGEKSKFVTDDPLATFARYRKVTFITGKDDRDHPTPHAALDIRAGWQEPAHGQYPCTLILKWGQREPVYRTIRLGFTVCLMRDIPVIVALEPLDEYATFSAVEVGVPERVAVPSSDFLGYVAYEWRFTDRPILRPERELLALQAELETLESVPREVVDAAADAAITTTQRDRSQ